MEDKGFAQVLRSQVQYKRPRAQYKQHQMQFPIARKYPPAKANRKPQPSRKPLILLAIWGGVLLPTRAVQQAQY